MPGNPSDRTTRPAFRKKIEEPSGKAPRIWVRDRGIPTKKDWAVRRDHDPPIHYLVGTPKGSLRQDEQDWLPLPWQAVRPGGEVKLLQKEKELDVLAQSEDRRKKERAMRRRQWQWLWPRRKESNGLKFSQKNDRMMKWGAAKPPAPSAGRLVKIEIAQSESELSCEFSRRKKKLGDVRRREGRYLRRSNLTEEQPVQWWHLSIPLTQVEEAFQNLKGDRSLPPLFQPKEARLAAHLFVAFLACGLPATLRRWWRDLAPGLTPRSVLDKFRLVPMMDVHLPTTDAREVMLSRYTQPERELQLLLNRLKLKLPAQPPPKITAAGVLAN